MLDLANTMLVGKAIIAAGSTPPVENAEGSKREKANKASEKMGLYQSG